MSDFLWTLEFFYRKLKQFCSILQEVRFKPETAGCVNAASVFSPPPPVPFSHLKRIAWTLDD